MSRESMTVPDGAARAMGALRPRAGPGTVRRRPLLLGPLLALLLLGAGCDAPVEEARTVVAFDTTLVTFETGDASVQLHVEVAQSDRQRQYGLMDRETLDPDWGMVFLFDSLRSPDQGFWMWRTHIPLDIAFIRPDSTVGAIRTMQPCPLDDPSLCRVYEAGVEHIAAVEANQGWFEARGVSVGDRFRVHDGDSAGDAGPPPRNGGGP